MNETFNALNAEQNNLNEEDMKKATGGVHSNKIPFCNDLAFCMNGQYCCREDVHRGLVPGISCPYKTQGKK